MRETQKFAPTFHRSLPQSLSHRAGRWLQLVLVASLIGLGSSAQAKLVCSDAFGKTASAGFASPALAQTVAQFENLLGAGNTTSLRQEDKYVVKNNVAAKMISHLETTEPAHFALRDKKLVGEKNVTVTDYARPIVIKHANGKTISAKIRFRKYYSTSDASPLGKSEMKSASITDGKTFLEAKIDHPDYNAVVIKPRILIADEDAALTQTRITFLANRTALAQRWKDANPKADPRLIDNFIQLFDRIYETEDSKLPAFAKTTYVRDSYSLMVQGVDPEARPIEIQFTLDQEVNVVDQLSGRVVDAYVPDDVVVEIKVPVSRAALSEADIAAYPALALVKEIKASLASTHEDRFNVGAGKLSTFRRALTLLPFIDE